MTNRPAVLSVHGPAAVTTLAKMPPGRIIKDRIKNDAYRIEAEAKNNSNPVPGDSDYIPDN